MICKGFFILQITKNNIWGKKETVKKHKHFIIRNFRSLSLGWQGRSSQLYWLVFSGWLGLVGQGWYSVLSVFIAPSNSEGYQITAHKAQRREASSLIQKRSPSITAAVGLPRVKPGALHPEPLHPTSSDQTTGPSNSTAPDNRPHHYSTGNGPGFKLNMAHLPGSQAGQYG